MDFYSFLMKHFKNVHIHMLIMQNQGNWRLNWKHSFTELCGVFSIDTIYQNHISIGK